MAHHLHVMCMMLFGCMRRPWMDYWRNILELWKISTQLRTLSMWIVVLSHNFVANNPINKVLIVINLCPATSNMCLLQYVDSVAPDQSGYPIKMIPNWKKFITYYVYMFSACHICWANSIKPRNSLQIVLRLFWFYAECIGQVTYKSYSFKD